MGGASCREEPVLAMLWLMDWLMQEAAKDLVKAEMGEDGVGDRKEVEDGDLAEDE